MTEQRYNIHYRKGARYFHERVTGLDTLRVNLRALLAQRIPATAYDVVGQGHRGAMRAWIELGPDGWCCNIAPHEGGLLEMYGLREPRAPRAKAERKAPETRHYTYKAERYDIPRRDSQRDKLYKAERAAFGQAFREPLADASLKGVQAYVDRITASATWRKLCSQHAQWWLRSKRVEVRPGCGARRAFARAGTITMPKWSRTKPCILHELAHIVAAGCDHQWPFADAYLSLVSAFIGRSAADALRSEFKKARVRWKPKKQMSPEARAALAERGRRALAAMRAARQPDKEVK